jgi:hypothetical protein
MNNIIPVSRLGELLSAKTGADVDACTKFVKEYFGLIEATLAAGEDVTIKGIGTFKLTGDDTDPVIYQVDDDLASTVNAPFEAFSAFELTDTELTDTAEPQETSEPSENSEISEDSEDSENSENSEDSENSENSEHSEHSEHSDIPEIPAHIAEPEQPTVSSESSEYSESSDNSEYSDIPEPTYPAPTAFPRGLTAFWMVIVFILGLLLGLAGGYFGHNYINTAITGAPQEQVVAPTDTVATSELSESSESSEYSESSESSEYSENSENSEPSEPAPAAPKEPRFDTITGSCYLTTLARKYYGNMDYWVYIYDANDLGNPNRITPGTKVRIPYPDELKLTGDSATDTRAARNRAAEIYAKYK